MRFGILGATEARRADGSVVPVRGPRLRALLARLLVEPGRAVSVERLIDDLYGHPAPAGVANALQSQVSRLRRALPDCPVELRPGGYRLDVDPDQVDVHRFEHLAREGARALASGDHHTAADRLGEALSLWRGPALADVVAPFAPGADSAAGGGPTGRDRGFGRVATGAGAGGGTRAASSGSWSLRTPYENGCARC